MINPPIKQAITDAGFVPVSLQAGGSCTAFSLWTEDRADYYLSSLEDGSNAIIVPNGFPLSINQKEPRSKTGRIICYAKGTTATNLVGLITK